MGHDVFISYKREEQERARVLAEVFHEQGWNVWWDIALRGGERFDRVIERTIKSSGCVLVLWSHRSVLSDFVLDEASLALRLGTLVPARLDAVEVPFRFANLHTRDLFPGALSPTHPAVPRLLDDVRAQLAASAAKAAQVPAASPAAAPANPAMPRQAPAPAPTPKPAAAPAPEAAIPAVSRWGRATPLATRCPACGTVFRVIADQLRVSEGWVRCGQCKEVFDATEGLVDLEHVGRPDALERKLERAEEFRSIGDAEGAKDLADEVAGKAEGPLREKALLFLRSLARRG